MKKKSDVCKILLRGQPLLSLIDDMVIVRNLRGKNANSAHDKLLLYVQ
jgi:hypothetical protein